MEAFKDRPDISNLIAAVAKKRGIENYILTDVTTNEKGEGYLGQIFLVTIKDCTTEQKLNLVIKAAFVDENVRKRAPIHKCYENECYFYSSLWPAYLKFENEREVSQKIDLVPKCYQVCLDDEKEMLCLENLKVSNFEMFDKRSIMDEDHVSLIFKTYGRFHAYSLALRDQQPEEYQKHTEKIHNIFLSFFDDSNGNFSEHLREYVKLAQKCLIPGEDDEILKKFEKYNGNGAAEIYRQLITEESQYPVIIHGDCWSNNMMFKYEKSGSNEKKLLDMRLLDLQIIYPGSPARDLAHCLYSGASKSIFSNLDKYLKIYHDSLSSFLRELGSDPNKLFPFEALKAEWKKFAKFGMMMALMIWKVKLTDKEDLIDMTDDIDSEVIVETIMKMKFDEESYRKLIRDLLYHFAEIDAL